MKNPGKTLLILGISVLIFGVACVIAGCICEIVGNTQLCKIFLIAGGGAGAISLVLLIVRFMMFGIKETPKEQTINVQSKNVRTVDVKDIPKTKDEKLYEEYEKLYSQGLISKEDLDKKRIELLGK